MSTQTHGPGGSSKVILLSNVKRYAVSCTSSGTAVGAVAATISTTAGAWPVFSMVTGGAGRPMAKGPVATTGSRSGIVIVIVPESRIALVSPRIAGTSNVPPGWI